MILREKIFLPFLLLLCQLLLAQNDDVTQLQEVVISDTQLTDFSNTQSVQKLNDSVIQKNAPSLTSLLAYNTVIYFKENGLGMVSSPSFRGTTAQQTAVIWNGININSQLNGQTDFNLFNARDFSSVAVRAGGGSVMYGSSAIGGSIHLNNDVSFGHRFTNALRLDYGSYNTKGLNYNLAAGNERFSTRVSISRNSSDNDYEYPGTDIINENGKFYNTSANIAFAYKLNTKNILRYYSYVFDGEKHFSRTLAAPSRSKYQDMSTRNLLEWTGYYNRFTSKLKAAHLYEKYKYFENHATDVFTFGKVNTFIARYDLSYDITKTLKVNAIVDYTHNNGEGSEIVNKKRDVASASLLLRHNVSNRLQYEIGMRQEITNAYQSPVLFSLGTTIAATSFYDIRLNASRNFRIPTYNDLYWPGSGNPYLKPETSYQAEVGNVLTFGNTTFTVTGYYIKLRDMLLWKPSPDGLWRPENLGRANTYGLEAIFNWKKKIGKGNLEFAGTYAYTVSREDGSSDQLMYVPLHKATASVAYSIKNISAFYRHLFNGEVFYTSDNESAIDPYNVSVLGIAYRFKILSGMELGLQVNNLWNEEYQNVNVRPMPGRNYNMYLNFNF